MLFSCMNMNGKLTQTATCQWHAFCLQHNWLKVTYVLTVPSAGVVITMMLN